MFRGGGGGCIYVFFLYGVGRWVWKRNNICNSVSCETQRRHKRRQNLRRKCTKIRTTYNLDLRIAFLRPFTSLRSLSIQFGSDVLCSLLFTTCGHACDVTCNTFLVRHGPNVLLVDATHFHQPSAAQRLEDVLRIRVVLHGGEDVLARQRE